MTNAKKTILITGGSSGIGLATAKSFAEKGFDILISSLEENELDLAILELKKVNESVDIKGLPIDLSIFGNTEKLYEWANKNTQNLEIVINNAGFGTFGFIDEIPMEKEQAMINLMVNNLYLSTRLFLKDMIKKNSGTIINISSISAFQPNPSLATYGACKAFVYQFTRAINEELKDKNLNVYCLAICPTPVRTNFQKTADMQKSILFDSWMTVDAPLVAQEIYDAYLAKKDYVIPGKLFHLLTKISKRLPDSLQIWLAKKHLAVK
jgi:uncharacterized protein